MNTFLLTWNPKLWQWSIQRNIKEIETKGISKTRWSCGSTKRIRKSNRFFMIRLGKEPKGIFASGWSGSTPYRDKHWINPRATALYIDIELDVLLDPDKDSILPMAELENGKLNEMNWHPRSSGISIPKIVATELEIKWKDFLGKIKNTDSDTKEQEELSEYIDTQSKEQIIKELKEINPQTPESVSYKGRRYKRDNQTTVQLKKLRDFKCQICMESILKKDGTLYIEAAHITPKKDKGPETPDNILILCPNHHKEFDLGNKTIREKTKEIFVFELNNKRYKIDLELKV